MTGPREDLIARARALAAEPGRRLLGIAGPPGAGKSTLAAALATAIGSAAVLVPMDGFHLAQAELVRLGRADRKGAPDTFDAAGFVALLQRLRHPDSPVRTPAGTPADTPAGSPAGAPAVYAPAFDRHLEEPIAGAIRVEPHVRLVIVEGNYLLLDDGPWAAVRPLLDQAWFLALDDEVRTERLVDRHVCHGRAPQEARAWVLRSDEANARLIAPTVRHADLVVRP